MSETFTASNGWHFHERGDLSSPDGTFSAWADSVAKMELAFTERRDHKLGRWRSKFAPEYITYPQEDGAFALVINENSGISVSIHRDDELGDTVAEEVADEYFAMNPLHRPLPVAPGLYVNISEFRTYPKHPCLLLLDSTGEWQILGQPRSRVRPTAQKWHDAGELASLGIVESEED